MPLLDLIKKLVALTEPDRLIDQEVAVELGFRREVSIVTSEEGKSKKAINWFSPAGKNLGVVPMFTSTFEGAKILSDLCCPGERAAASWADERGYAKIGNGRHITAVNPQIALCIAALVGKLEKEHPRKEPSSPAPEPEV